MSDEKQLSPAQQLYQTFERLKATTDAERARELDATHGRRVGGVPRRVVQEGERAPDFTPPPKP